MIVILCLNHRNRIVGTQIQKIICPLGFFTEDKIPFQVDFPVRDSCFHGDLSSAPFGGHGRCDVLELDVLLRHAFLRQNSAHSRNLLC